jgi:transposase
MLAMAVIGTAEGWARWTLPMLWDWIEGWFGKHLHPASLSRVVRRLDLSWQKTRPLHSQADERAKAASAEEGS